jgi:zinc transport system permease protein
VNPLDALRLAPIARGFLVLALAGALFPLTGVFILRLNLITLRFTLMHGTLLAGALALALGADPVLLSVAVNLALILAIAGLGRRSGLGTGTLTTFLMVLTVGLAFVIIYRFNVPAKDTLAILWGNLFAISPSEAAATAGFAALTLAFVLAFYGGLKAMLFSREIAFASGVNEPLLYNAVLALAGLTVAFAVRLIGALLLDALLLLPAIVASFYARSTRALFVYACAAGFGSSVIGFVASLVLDVPASSAVTIVAALLLGFGFLTRGRLS